MSETEINKDAAGALVRVVNIQELTRGLSADLLLCFGDCCRPRFSSVFDVADGAIKALKDLSAGGA